MRNLFKILPLIVLALFAMQLSFGQILLQENFDASSFPSTWSRASNGAEWDRTASSSGSGNQSHSGAGKAEFKNGGGLLTGLLSIILPLNTGLMVSPVINFTAYTGGSNVVNVWVYRTSKKAGNADKLDFYLNTTTSLSGATFLETIHRNRNLAPQEEGTGWYRYSFDVPVAFNSAPSAYLLIKGTYDNGEEILLDDVSVSHCAASVSASVSNVTCMGSENGTINVTVNNAIAPYSFEWSVEANPFSWDEDVTNLTSGYYDVIVLDAVGCKAYGSYQINQPAALYFTANVSPVACNATTGTIIATPSGGTPTYSYSWTGPNSFTSTQKDIIAPPGLYSLTLTDTNGCTSVGAYTIGEAIGVSGNLVHNTCYGGNAGNIQLVINGGTSPYNYNWSNNASATSISNSNLAAGTYSVLVSDPNGCKGSGTFIINQPYEIIIADTISHVSCFSGNNGSIKLNVSGGTPPYTYNWNNTASTKNISNLTAGAYEVTITDANMCTKTASFTVIQPAILTASNTASNILCNGANTGAIDVSVTGGTLPYAYTWSGSSVTTEDRNSMAPGNYTVSVIDAKGCTTSSTAILSQPAALAISSSKTNILCNGGNNGGIDISIAGGTAPYSFSWSNSATSEDLSGLGAGTYSVTVTDANNCSKTASFTLSQPSPIVVGNNITNVSCFGGSNGKVDINVSVGVAPYTYSWSNNSTVRDQHNITAGSYTVTITDGNGCTDQQSYTVSESPALVVTGTTADALCNGSNTGSITLTATGGTPDNGSYDFTWNNNSHSQNRTGLTAGTYSVTVEDKKHCIAIASFTISQPTPIVVSPVINNLLCNGINSGSISLSVSGGTGTYSYLWNSNNGTMPAMTGLAAGTYSVTVQDANSCSKTASFVVTQPSGISIGSQVANATCNGSSNGSINITPIGGAAPYTYSWSNAAVSEDISGILAGTYTVVVTDGNGCTKQGSYNVAQPAVLSSTGSQTNVLCNNGTNGTIDLSVNGGTSPYSYNWGANVPTTQDRSGLTAGTYNVVVTDAKGCVSSASFTISQPTMVAVTAIVNNVLCNGGNSGSINLNVTGGTGVYTYMWNTNSIAPSLSNLAAGTYTVTVKDANNCSKTASATISQPGAMAITGQATNASCKGLANCSINITPTGGVSPYTYNWSNNASTQNIAGLAPGTYSVTVTDAKGCTKASPAYSVSQPSALNVTGSTVGITCSGGNTGAINLSISGGTSPYNCNWSNNCVTPNQSALAAGTYNVVVTDAKGCTDNASFAISQTPGMTVTGAIVHPACNSNNGKVTLTIAGGTGTKTYLWNNGSTSKDRTNLAPGVYSVTVKDANNCTATASFILSLPLISVNSTVNNVSCNGADNGSISLSGNGGTSPYTFDWYNSSSTSTTRTNLEPGTYIVNMKDSKNCSVNDTFVITEPAVITVSGNKTDVSCNNANNGMIALAVTGGTTPYTYLWSNSGGTSANRNNLDAGTYTVTVKDSKNCTKTASYTISEPSALAVTTVKTNATCSTCANGSINATITGGTTPYSYHWSNNATIQDLNSKTPGTYTLTVTDANGCTKTKTETVGVTSVPTLGGTITVTPMYTVNPGGAAFTIYEGYGPQTVTLTAAGSGGVPPYTYTWSGTSVTTAARSVSPSNTTTYVVTIKDATNATVTRTQQIKVVDVSACGGKVKVCHNGNNTLEISANAVPAHLAHGDYLGECENSCNSRIIETPKDEHSHEAKIKVYPNPSTGVFTIEVPYEGGNIDILITDIHGKLIERKSVLKNWEPQYRFDFSNLAKGVYMVLVKTEEQVIKEKVLIQ